MHIPLVYLPGLTQVAQEFQKQIALIGFLLFGLCWFMFTMVATLCYIWTADTPYVQKKCRDDIRELMMLLFIALTFLDFGAYVAFVCILVLCVLLVYGLGAACKLW